MADEERSEVLPLHEEVLRVDKREVVKGRVRIRTVTNEYERLVTQDLARESVEVSRVLIDREVESAPEVRQEGDVLIVPILEEILVVEKRLVLKEELHIRRSRAVEQTEASVMLRRQEAVVERTDAADDNVRSKETNK